MRISDWSSDVCSSDLSSRYNLTRSSLHRCLQRHGISRLPKADREKPKKFKKYEIGYFHVDIAELRYEGGRGFLYVEVDRTSKLVFARIYRRATKLDRKSVVSRKSVSVRVVLGGGRIIKKNKK